MAKRKDTQLIAEAGQHFVAAELCKRGYIASLTAKGTKNIDLLAASNDGTNPFSIQVKTNSHGKKYWMLNEKAENLNDKALYYVFVELNGIDISPTYHIVPSKDVVKYIKDGHTAWLNTPGKKGQQHSTVNKMRIFEDKDGKYLNNWKLLPLNIKE